MRPALALAWETPREWAEAALEDPLALLADHAHCELGAAASAQSLLARHGSRPALVARLAALAVEELQHFHTVHRLLASLGGELGPARANPYAEGLLAGAGRGVVDRLLVSALIERRSLERFGLLARAARARLPRLADLYQELAPAEAGHAALFVELARACLPEGEGTGDIDRRLERWVEREAALARSLPFAPRIHSGPPASVRGSAGGSGP